MSKLFYYTTKVTLQAVFRTICGVKVVHHERLPDSGPVIVAGNHASFLDPILLGTFLRREMCFMARKTLFDHWPLRPALQGLNAFPLDRDGGAHAAMREFGILLEQGRCVVMFPEGTRTRTGLMQPIKPGAGLIAVRNNAPILPVYVWGSYQSWPRNRKLPRPHRLRLYLGEPLYPAQELNGPQRKAEQERLNQALATSFSALEAEAYAGLPPPVPLAGELPPPEPAAET